MRKSVLAMGLSGVLAISSVVPAFASPAGNITDSVESVTYNADAGQTYEGAWEGAISEETKVEVNLGSTFTVKIPVKLVLAGKRGEANKVDYSVAVDGDIPGDVTINVVPNTAHTTSEFANIENDFKGGSGTFALKEKAGVKKDIVATITQADGTWTMADDGTDNGTGAASIVSVAKTGSVEVANLSAGEWSNTINFDVSATK